MTDVDVSDDRSVSGSHRDDRVAVDAICTGCRETRVKWVSEEEAGGSFRDVCHGCQSVQWMNTVRHRPELERRPGGDQR